MAGSNDLGGDRRQRIGSDSGASVAVFTVTVATALWSHNICVVDHARRGNGAYLHRSMARITPSS